MSWFRKRSAPPEKSDSRKVVVPEGLWIKCDNCGEIVYSKEIERNLKTCPKCDYHFRISAKERIRLLEDPGTFEEFDARILSEDPLNFRDSQKYRDRIKNAVKKTGLNEAVLSGTCTLDGLKIVLVVFDFFFLGGSMASVVGEKVTRAVERAIQEKCGIVVISSSGGARMQEGALSLMQMAKTSAALARLRRAGLPFISVLTDPTTGGVTASFAMLGDVNLAEPKALIGFAGPRVIEQTIRQELPEGFQRSEFLLEHGMIDKVVSRKELKKTIVALLKAFKNQ
ncbi:MAG: acetyl-CoA carboxylase carboxyltransferase subunit beta [Proteobacteria bacterium]|nr:acetyl-CoA carboxylase carboxyltransferase subunit beta [Pseudomonadota bacterium]